MRTTFVVLYLTLLLAIGCTPQRVIDQLTLAESLCEEHPDSSLSLVGSIPNRRFHTKELRARHALLYCQALDKAYMDVDNDSLAAVAVNYYSKNGTPQQRATAYYYLGRVNENGGDLESCMSNLLLAESNISDQLPQRQAGLIYAAIARQYFNDKQMNLSIERYLKAAAIYEQLGMKYHYLYCLNRITSAYIVLADGDNAQHYNAIAKRAAEGYDNIELLRERSLYDSHIALKFSSDKREAVDALYSYYNRYTEGIPLKEHYIQLTNAYLGLKKIDSAAYFLQKHIDERVDTLLRAQFETQYLFGRVLSNTQLRAQFEVQYLFGRVLSKQHNYKEAYEKAESAILLLNELYFVDKEQSVVEMEAKFHNERLKLENINMQTKHLYQLIIFISIVILLTSAAIYFILRSISRSRSLRAVAAQYKSSFEDIESQYCQLRDSYDSHMDSDSNIKSTISTRIDFIKEMLDVTALYAYNKDVQVDKLKEVIASNGSVVQIIRDMMELQYPGINSYIRSKYESLSDSDIDMYFLTCSDMSINAISLTLNISQKTVYNRRNIIKSKLNIHSREIDLKDHFMQITSEFWAPNRLR